MTYVSKVWCVPGGRFHVRFTLSFARQCFAGTAAVGRGIGSDARKVRFNSPIATQAAEPLVTVWTPTKPIKSWKTLPHFCPAPHRSLCVSHTEPCVSGGGFITSPACSTSMKTRTQCRAKPHAWRRFLCGLAEGRVHILQVKVREISTSLQVSGCQNRSQSAIQFSGQIRSRIRTSSLMIIQICRCEGDTHANATALFRAGSNFVVLIPA